MDKIVLALEMVVEFEMSYNSFADIFEQSKGFTAFFNSKSATIPSITIFNDCTSPHTSSHSFLHFSTLLKTKTKINNIYKHYDFIRPTFSEKCKYFQQQFILIYFTILINK